jgi:pimeloyl-ACP methyl ester carboxylesterase
MRLVLTPSSDYLEVTPAIFDRPVKTAVIFLHGFTSDQTGEKATHFREVLSSRGVAYITFDFRGHGQSSGTMRQLTGTRLLEDCHAVIEHVCPPESRIVLIGSSMGGWVAAWYAAQHPDRITANLLIAPSFTFGQSFLDDLSPEQAARWADEGVIRFANEYGSVDLGYDLIRDAGGYPVAQLYQRYRTPTLICHGLADDIVDYRQSLAFVQQCASTDIDVLLLKNGDHRLTAQKTELAAWLLLYLEHRWLRD